MSNNREIPAEVAEQEEYLIHALIELYTTGGELTGLIARALMGVEQGQRRETTYFSNAYEKAMTKYCDEVKYAESLHEKIKVLEADQARWIPVSEWQVGAHEWAYVFDRRYGPREAQFEPELVGGTWICRTGLRLWEVTHVYPLPPYPRKGNRWIDSGCPTE